MHGDEDKLANIPFIGKALAKTAQKHIEHHKEVNMNMRLTHEQLHNKLFFSWETLIQTSIVLSIFGLFVKYNIKMDNTKYIIYIAYLSLLYTILWNNIHVDMHGVKGTIRINDGVPNKNGLLSRGPLYRFLWKYHAVHHLQKGDEKGNYNIVLPGMDYIFGTYNGFCYDNTEYCRKNYDSRCHDKIKACVTDNDVI